MGNDAAAAQGILERRRGGADSNDLWLQPRRCRFSSLNTAQWTNRYICSFSVVLLLVMCSLSSVGCVSVHKQIFEGRTCWIICLFLMNGLGYLFFLPLFSPQKDSRLVSSSSPSTGNFPKKSTKSQSGVRDNEDFHLKTTNLSQPLSFESTHYEKSFTTLCLWVQIVHSFIWVIMSC